MLCSPQSHAMPSSNTCKDIEKRRTPVLDRYHGEIAKQKGSGTISPLWNRTGALS
jgi:hypothetical protein